MSAKPTQPARPRKAKSTRPPASAQGPSGFVPDGFYRDMVWNLRNGVIAITRDGRVAVMNDIAYRTLGLKPSAADIGRHYSDVLKDAPDVCRIVSSAFDLSHLPNRAELRLKNTEKVIGYTLSHVRDSRGRDVGATLFFKDLTRVEQLEERERLRDRRQLSELPDAQSTLGDIIKEAKMANVIVQEVLAFVRPLRLQVEDIAVADVIRDAIAAAESHSVKGKVDVRVDVPEALRPIQGDPHQLRQIFTNLLTNAFEAMGGMGNVEIAATAVDGDEEMASAAEQATGPTIMITITDNGPGIPPEVVDRIFSPFFTTKPQGSGLGLAIVRKIVDAHDGRIDVGERHGGGTVFRVTLPVRNQQQLFG